MALMINVSKKGTGEVLLSLMGSIDTETGDDFEKKMDEAVSIRPKAIVLDMAGLKYINSVGLSILVKAEKVLKKDSRFLILINIPSQIMKVIEVIKALPAMYIFQSLEEADAYLLKIQQDEIDKKG